MSILSKIKNNTKSINGKKELAGKESKNFKRTQSGNGKLIYEKKQPLFSKRQMVVVLLVLGLVVFGCIMVYSASCYSAEYRYGNQYFFLFSFGGC